MGLFNNNKLRDQIRRDNADRDAERRAHEADHVNPYDHQPTRPATPSTPKRR